MTDERIKRLEDEIAAIKRSTNKQPEKSDFSIFWFIVWLILCWPIAAIYLVYKCMKNK